MFQFYSIKVFMDVHFFFLYVHRMSNIKHVFSFVDLLRSYHYIIFHIYSSLNPCLSFKVKNQRVDLLQHNKRTIFPLYITVKSITTQTILVYKYGCISLFSKHIFSMNDHDHILLFYVGFHQSFHCKDSNTES